MKNRKFLLLCGVLIVLAGCGAEPLGADKSPAISSNAVISSAVSSAPEEPETTPLSDVQIESAKQAALDYYKDTVFTVNTLEYMEDASLPDNADCAFSANVSKDGEVQDPNRTIFLKMTAENQWEVTTEGY